MCEQGGDRHLTLSPFHLPPCNALFFQAIAEGKRAPREMLPPMEPGSRLGGAMSAVGRPDPSAQVVVSMAVAAGGSQAVPAAVAPLQPKTVAPLVPKMLPATRGKGSAGSMFGSGRAAAARPTPLSTEGGLPTSTEAAPEPPSAAAGAMDEAPLAPRPIPPRSTMGAMFGGAAGQGSGGVGGARKAGSMAALLGGKGAAGRASEVFLSSGSTGKEGKGGLDTGAGEEGPSRVDQLRASMALPFVSAVEGKGPASAGSAGVHRAAAGASHNDGEEEEVARTTGEGEAQWQLIFYGCPMSHLHDCQTHAT